MNPFFVGALVSAQDSLAVAIPSFTDRFNFMLPMIVVLLIVMFFLLVKSYTMEHPASEERQSSRPRKKIKY